ncbi:hypothetical protein MJI37_32075, partial [Salmonella enterica subsp. enterica serovar Cerro]|nr:hypothetical protein [Salmonella enterica subsp. enterica serovar Cerro]
QRMPESRSYFYQDLMLPVLLDSLRGGWQANELARPLVKLKAITERTREIGIRMAVGARASDVLQQFLIEAVLVCLVGGALGISL